MKIRFSKKWFNPLYFILNDIIEDDSIRIVLVYGGKSSAKTVSISQILSKECYLKGSNTIAFRKESASIPTTLKKSFNLSIETTRLNKVIETQDRKYLANNGSAEIVLRGLDDSEKAKGVESYKYLYFDELNHFEAEEFEQANLSLRGIQGQKIFASWNPVDENSWVKTGLVDLYEWQETDYKLPCPDSFVHKSTCGKVVLIKTTYEDNYWITGSPCGFYGYKDENLISEYQTLRTRNYNSYKVNVLGEWGKTTFGGEFLKCWRTETHTGTYPYNPKLAVHLIFDENVNPYFPCGIFQIGDNQKDVFLIDYLALKNPNNTTKAMGRELTRKLKSWGHREYVFIGGDATSQKDDVKQEKGHDFFALMMNELKEFKPRRNVLKSNPSVRMSADFFNAILSEEFAGIKYRVDKSCKQVIQDYENTKEDKNGKVDKRTITDLLTKVSYQPWGHFTDLSRYFLVTTFAAEYYKFQFGDKKPRIITGRNIPNSKHVY
jgi:hypothetical protein